jgi:hypothetical protein
MPTIVTVYMYVCTYANTNTHTHTHLHVAYVSRLGSIVDANYRHSGKLRVGFSAQL